MEGNFHNLINIIYKTPTTNMILNGVKLEAIPLRSGTMPDIHSHHSFSTLY